MRKCYPDRRWRNIAEAVERGKPPAAKSLRRVYEICITEPDDDETSYEEQAIRDAIDLIKVGEDREILMVFFLAGANDEDIATSLGIPRDVLLLVRQLIFEEKEFRNKLELRRYTREYAEALLSKENAELLQTALSMGPSYLVSFFRHGHEEVAVDTKRYGKLLLEQAAQKGLVGKSNPITSMASRLARDWSKDASSMIINAEKMGFGDEISDRAQALLDEEDDTVTPEDLGLSLDDIQH
jgi:hypothetical protein